MKDIPDIHYSPLFTFGDLFSGNIQHGLQRETVGVATGNLTPTVILGADVLKSSRGG